MASDAAQRTCSTAVLAAVTTLAEALTARGCVVTMAGMPAGASAACRAFCDDHFPPGRAAVVNDVGDRVPPPLFSLRPPEMEVTPWDSAAVALAAIHSEEEAAKAEALPIFGEAQPRSDASPCVLAGAPVAGVLHVVLCLCKFNMDLYRRTISQCRASGVSHLIVLVRYPLFSAVAHAVSSTPGMRIETFVVSSLRINPLLHVLVPLHTVIAADDAIMLRETRALRVQKMPVMSTDDPCARLLGLLPGSTVEMRYVGCKQLMGPCFMRVDYVPGALPLMAPPAAEEGADAAAAPAADAPAAAAASH